MLSAIRDKLKGWVVFVLLILVAIPLVFMGLGNYQTTSENYSLIVDDQVITTAKLDQEVYLHKQALNKNFKGNIPPLYTDSFIKKLTLEYMLRTILLDNSARKLGLTYHNQSIINDIKNTSSFRDNKGFNSDLYERQLFNIGMKSKNYENYIYQKGINKQLKTSITETSFITKPERKSLINFRFHTRKGNYFIIPLENIKKDIHISDNEISNYFTNNKKDFMSQEKAIFNYIDIDKFDLIKSIKVNDSILQDIYKNKINNGDFLKPSKYKIKHFFIKGATNENQTKATNARKELLKGSSFKNVIKKYSNDKETMKNEGNLGELILDDLPPYIRNIASDIDLKAISEIIESDKGYHIISIYSKTDETILSFKDVKNTILNEYQSEHGSRLFYDNFDKINEDVFKENESIASIAIKYNLKTAISKTITPTNGHGVFNYPNVRQRLFSKEIIKNSANIELINISDNRFLIVSLKEYMPKKQLSLDDSQIPIKTLLLANKSNLKIKNTANSIVDELNSKKSTQSKYTLVKYKINIDTTAMEDEIKSILLSLSTKNKYNYKKLNSGDYLIYNLLNITYPEKGKITDDENLFSNFIINTRSESEFDLFFKKIKASSKIKINNDYLDNN